MVLYKGGRVRIWNTKTGTVVGEPIIHTAVTEAKDNEPAEPKPAPIHAFSIAHDLKQIITVSKDGQVLFWSLKTGAQIEGKSLSMTENFGVTPSSWRPRLQMAYNAGTHRLAISATPNLGHTHIAVWDVKNNKALPHHIKAKHPLSALQFTADGKQLVMALHDYSLQAWNVETNVTSRTESGHEGFIEAIHISPDGKRLATASDDETVRVYDIASWHELVSLSGHERSVISVAFSADGHKLASVAEDQSLLVRHVFPNVQALKEHICIEFKYINVAPKIERKFPGQPEMKLEALCANTSTARRTSAPDPD